VLHAWVGIPVAEFGSRFQAAQVERVPTLVVTDRRDRLARYDDVVLFAESVGAPLLTTDGLGHRKILRDPAVVARVVDFVSSAPSREGHGLAMPAPAQDEAITDAPVTLAVLS
jgi:pimeloyl-ACP methyl ester carboxylesterase